MPSLLARPASRSPTFPDFAHEAGCDTPATGRSTRSTRVNHRSLKTPFYLLIDGHWAFAFLGVQFEFEDCLHHLSGFVSFAFQLADFIFTSSFHLL